MTLEYRGRLPDGALIRRVVTAPDRAAPVHLRAEQGAMGFAAGTTDRVIRWACATRAAVPVAPNTAGTRFDGRALVFEPGVQGGLCLPGALPDTGACAFGLIYQATGETPETLLTLQPAGRKDYLYLAQRGATVLAGQDAGDLALHLPAPDTGVHLVLCALDAGRATLMVNGASATGTLGAGWDSGAADLFVGCRGQRGGLKRKLGGFRLTDVMIWPQGLDEAGSAAARAVWQERMRDAA